MRFFLPLLLLSCGPGHEVLSETPCGVRILAMPYEDHKEIGPDAARTLEAAGIGRDLFSCTDLQAAKVDVAARRVSTWINGAGTKIAGQTWCRNRVNERTTAEIGNAKDFPAHSTAFLHELRHAIDCPEENYDHVGWDTLGIYDKIYLANSDVELGRLK